MPRAIAVTNSFTTGELSPGAYGRTDLQKYNSGLTCCMNFIVEPLGGVRRRAGTRFVCETKTSQFLSRVLPFQFSVTQAYVIEAGCTYLRFFKNNVYVPLTTDLVVNGTFDTNLSGWTTTTTGSGQATWVAGGGGKLFLSAPITATSTAKARQDVTVVSGSTYQLTFNTQSTLRLSVFVGSTSGASDLLNVSIDSDGTRTYSITAVSTTISISFYVASVVSTSFAQAYIDNVGLVGPTQFELTTPYNDGDLANIDVVQSGDEQYWLNSCYAVRKLSRFADNCWRFNCVVFSPPPSIEYGARSASDIQPAAISGNGVNVTAFNNTPAFLAADVGREIKIVSGTNAGARAGIKSVTSGTVAVVNICVPFITTGVNCTGTWIITGSPQTRINPATGTDVGKSVTITADSAAFRNGNPGETDIGKFIAGKGGLIEITAVGSTTSATGTIRSALTDDKAIQSGAWSLEEAIWSCNRGYPSTGDFFEDRLWLDAGFRFAGSKTSDYENFAGGVNDDDGVLFGINSKTINAIRAIVGGRALQIFTTGGEYVAKGGTDSPITPSTVQVSNETTHGASNVTPIRVSDVTLFLTRFGRQLREFTQRADVVSDAFVAPDLLLLASHLTETYGIVDLAYQREPTSTIWAVRSDGILLSCAYRREENVVAWAQHQTCGAFESVCVIPHPDGNREQVWFIVNRTINGSTKRYVEYMDDSALYYDRRFTDASVVYNNCVPVSVFTGLDHLECSTVHIQADGAFVGTCVVAQGRVGIVTPASKVEIGLPIVSEITTLEPEVSFGGGSIQPMKKHWSRVFVRVRDTCNLMVRTNQGQLEFIRDARGNVMTGSGVKDYDMPRLSGFTDAKIMLRQEQPLPAHILMVGGVLDVGDA